MFLVLNQSLPVARLFCTNTLYIYIKLATSNHSENRTSQMSTYVLYNNKSDGVLFCEFE